MNEHDFLIKYYEIALPQSHWLNGKYAMCNGDIHCYVNCPIKKIDCRRVFGEYSPKIPKEIFDKFILEHPEYFI